MHHKLWAWRKALLLVASMCVTLAAADTANTCPDQDMYRNVAIVCAICAGVLFVVVLIMTFFMKRILDHQRISRQLVADRNNLRFSSARSTSDVMSASQAPTTTVSLTEKSFISQPRGAQSDRSVTTNLGRALSGFDQSIDAILGAPTLVGGRAPAGPMSDDFVGTGLNSVELKMQRAARRANIRRKSSFNSEDFDDEEDDQLAVSHGVNIVSQDPYLNRANTSPRRVNLEPGAARDFSTDALHRGKSGSQASLDFEWPDVDSDSDAGGDEVDLSARRELRNKKAGSASDYGYTDFAPLPPGTIATEETFGMPPDMAMGGSVQSIPGSEGEALAAFDAAINALDEVENHDGDEVEEI